MSCLSRYLLYTIIKNPIGELTHIGYGADVDKNPFPRLYDVYIAIQDKKIYYCKTDGVWTEYTDDCGGYMNPILTIAQPGSINTIAGNSQVTIVTYTNNTGGVLRITGCLGHGTVDAEYVLAVNGDIIGTVMSSEQDRNGKIIIERGYRINNGDIVTVKVTHFHDFTADFKATIYGHKFEGD